MKTSNKILLGAFLVMLLSITGIHLALYAKIKSGDFVSSTDVKELTVRHTLRNVKYVSIIGLENCNINPPGEPMLSTDKIKSGRFSFRLAGDSLFLVGDSTATQQDLERGRRNHQTVNLVLPATVQVKLDYGSLNLSGGPDSASAPSYTIEASHAHIGAVPNEPVSMPLFFKQLNMVIDKAQVTMENNTVVNDMNIRAVSSELIYNQSSIHHMTLDIDSSTTVLLSGKNIKNAQIISKP